MKIIFGSQKNDLQNFFPSGFKRYYYLQKIKKTKIYKTNFILRKKYRAGLKNRSKERDITEKEFFDNIKANVFTFCVRGGGNFSVRFYETIACGRIPLYFDTNTKLPLDDEIDWNSHILILKPEDTKKHIKEKIYSFIEKNDLEKIQLKNREIWKSHLERKAYIKQLFLKYR